jgi:hypothetical protein
LPQNSVEDAITLPPRRTRAATRSRNHRNNDSRPSEKPLRAAAVAHWAESQFGATGILIGGGIIICVGLLLFALTMAAPPTNIVIEPAQES